ncbi:unnamed protein product [Candidula unifasciata]|uniref:Uncharacterized protein n=1 Tax=Candidula unifasciata TaxID=100452 RepID=A0A8S3Z0E2_9EUPU|nr:unnamed protein product [Candidula unifasciata]
MESNSSPTIEETLTSDDSSNALDGALEGDQPFDICHLCEDKLKSPKILSCLHEFCEDCLKKKLESDKEGENVSPSSPLAKEWMIEVIKCPICDQKTRLPEKGVSGLLSDLVLEDIMESDRGDKQHIGCTSCKAGDNAVARCRTCENLLCPNCVTAHQFMRCFEDHKVVTFEEMISTGEGIEHLRKPVFCLNHSLEIIKYFCTSCNVPACGECLQKSHSSPEHVVKQLAEGVGAKKGTLVDFTNECANKLIECQKMNASLNAAFEDLEMQKDNTKGLIMETFQSYKALLEDLRDKYLNEADELHGKRELCLMDRMHKLSTYENQLSQAKNFVERVCQNGHAGQICQLLQPMLTQLNTLCMGFIMPDIPANTEFRTDVTAFTNVVKSHFGYFSKEKNSSVNGSAVCSPFEAEHFSLPSMMSLGNSNMMPPQMNHDLMNSINNLTREHLGLGIRHDINNLQLSNVISCLSSVNLSNHTENSALSGNNSPFSDSGISVDNVSHSSGGNAMINAAAMMKLHNPSPLFTGMGIGGPAGNMMTAAGDNALASFLGPATPNPGSSMSVQHANIEGLVSLLNQPPPSLGSLANIGPFEQFTSIPSELSSPGGSLNGELFSAARRNAAKVNPMQISRFQGAMGDTEIGHWGPQHKQINEVPLRCKFGQLGPGKGQFNSPHGFCLGVDEDIIVADTNNHRIQIFLKTGEFKNQFGIPGREEGQLWYPRKVAVMLKVGKFVVCDRGNERSRMQIFNRNGHFLKKIAIRYIDIVAGLAITPEGNIVAVDSVSPTVFVISEAGDLIKWFDCSDFMREPSDIAVNNNEYFVCDFKFFPNGIDISGHGDVLIGDSHGNRSLISEFQCPYVKVSRCCGLKITSEGYIVTWQRTITMFWF